MRDIYYSAKEVIVWFGYCEADRKPDDEYEETLASTWMENLKSRDRTDILNLLREAGHDEDYQRCWKALNRLIHHS